MRERKRERERERERKREKEKKRKRKKEKKNEGGKMKLQYVKNKRIIKKYYDTKGQKTMITEFSKYLKMYAYEFLGSYDESNKPRKFLQELGDEVRKINNDFLIN